MNITYEKLKKIDSEYNAVKVLLLIIKIRFSKSEPEREKYKIQLFLMMAKVIVKNIENFWYLAKPHSYAHHIIETTELISECYIALEISIKNFGARKTGNVRYNVFQIKPGTENEYIYDYSTNLDFYFYFNKTLTQRLNRTVQKILATNTSPSDCFVYLRNETKHDEKTSIDVSLLLECNCTVEEVVFVVLRVQGFNDTEISKKRGINYSTIKHLNATVREKIINHLLSP